MFITSDVGGVCYQLKEEGCLVSLESGLGVDGRGLTVDVILCQESRSCGKLLDELHGNMLVVQFPWQG